MISLEKFRKTFGLANLLRFLLPVLFFAFGLFLVVGTSLHPRNLMVMTDQNKTNRTAFPYIGYSDEKGPNVLKFSGSLDYQAWSSEWVQIVPDDKVIDLKINGKSVDLSAVEYGSAIDQENGFTFQIGKFLDHGENKFVITLDNSSKGKSGLNFHTSARDWKFCLSLILVLAAFLALLYNTLRMMKWNRPLIAVLLSAVVLYSFYLVKTPFDRRSHDAYSHIAYIEYIVFKGSLPSPEMKEFGVFYHPPLYYLSAAGVYSAVNAITKGDKTAVLAALQSLSLLYFIFYLIAGIMIIRTVSDKLDLSRPGYMATGKGLFLTKDRFTMFLASIFVFWPANFIHSVRISNEPMMYLFWAISLLFLLRWHFDGKDRDAYLSLLFTLLAFLVKFNTVILAGVAGVLFLVKFFQDRDRKGLFIKTGVLAVILIIGTAVCLGDRILLKLGKMNDGVIMNITKLDQRLQVGNDAENYLYFDLKNFITQAFTSPWQDEYGRQYFPNYLSKTSLFGEFSYTGRTSHNLGVGISALFLILLLGSIASFFLMKKEQFLKFLPLTLTMIVSLASMVVLRVLYPINIDFRYILPALVPGIILFGYTVLELRRKELKPLFYLGVTAALAFTVLNVFFLFSIQ